MGIVNTVANNPVEYREDYPESAENTATDLYRAFTMSGCSPSTAEERATTWRGYTVQYTVQYTVKCAA